MRNITLAVEDAVLEEVRAYAEKHNTSVNDLVRDFLEGVAEQESKANRARRRLGELIGQSKLEAGPVTWSRDSVHDR